MTRPRYLVSACAALGLVLIGAVPAAAQQIVQLAAKGAIAAGTITANGGSFTFDTSGMNSLRIQTLDTYTGTWEVQCSVDGSTFDADDEVLLSLEGATTTAVTEVSDTVGIWSANVAGCRTIKIIATAGFAATDVNFAIQSTQSGGGSGSGGGGGGGGGVVEGPGVAGTPSGGVLSVQGVAGGTAQPVTCSNCSGSGVSVNEDAASADAHPGTPAYAVRQNTLSALTGADGDYQPIKSTAGGATYIAPTFGDTVASTGTGASGAQTQRVVTATDSTIGTVTTVTGVTNVATIGTSVTPGTAAANLGKAEDGVHGTGDTGVLSLAVRRDANTSLVDTTGDNAPLQVDATGSLKVAIISGAGSGGTALADNAAFTPGTTSFTPVGGEVDDTGTTAATENSAAAVRMTVQRGLHVNLRTAAGAELTPATDATHDSAASATGPQVMGEATSALSTDTAVADGDATRVKTDLLGRQITIEGCGRQDRVRGQVTIIDGSSQQVLAAQGSGIITEIYEIEIANTSGTDVSVDIRDGTAGAVLWTLMAPATTDTGGGNNRTFTIPLTFTANTIVAADPSAAATSIIVSVMGCKVL